MIMIGIKNHVYGWKCHRNRNRIILVKTVIILISLFENKEGKRKNQMTIICSPFMAVALLLQFEQ